VKKEYNCKTNITFGTLLVREQVCFSIYEHVPNVEYWSSMSVHSAMDKPEFLTLLPFAKEQRMLLTILSKPNKQ